MSEDAPISPERKPFTAIEVPAGEVDRTYKDFLALRQGNYDGYVRLVDEQFRDRVGGQIDSQNVYLSHHIEHSGARLVLFLPEYPRLSLNEISELSRGERAKIFSDQTTLWAQVLGDSANLSRKVKVPYRGEMTGYTFLGSMLNHELRHLDYNRAAFAKHEVAFTESMEYMGI